jgi:hypothetical protein
VPSRLAIAAAAALVAASMLAPPAFARRDFYDGPDPRCSWYKQQAMNEGRKARATTGQAAKQHRARSDAYWKQYNDCLRGNDW